MHIKVIDVFSLRKILSQADVSNKIQPNLSKDGSGFIALIEVSEV